MKLLLFSLFKQTTGASLVELLIAIGLAGILLPGLITGIIASSEGKAQQKQRIQALALITEAQEAVRVVRERGWDVFSPNGTYHPSISANTWTLVPNAQTIQGFTRAIEISDVYRDSNGAIIETGGEIDLSTKRVVITVSWTTPTSSSIQTTGYLSRYLENITFTETAEDDFNAGTHTGTTVTNSDGGEVVLGAGGSGSWCAPELTINALDLPKNGVANAISATEGQIITGTGNNASGVSLAGVSVANTSPPTSFIEATVDGYKTNDVFGESNFAYIATDTNSEEVVILDLNSISGGQYTKIGSFDSPGSTDASAIVTSGDIGYVIAGNTLHTFNLSSKSGSRPLLTSRSLSGTGTAIQVVDNYAYVSISGSSRELEIFQISPDGTSINPVAYADVNANGGQDIFVNQTGTRAFLAGRSSASQNEFFIIDTNSKSGALPLIGSYDSGGMSPRSITVVTGNKAILVGSGGMEYQVIDITNETNPISCGGLEIDSGVNGVASVLEADGDAYSYIITGDTSSELKIIEGGPGGNYSTEGIFESQIFDPGASTAFNRISATFSTPNQTTTSYQVAIADPVSGSCEGAEYVFVGPDGTSATSYTTDGAIPFDNDGTGYENPGRCFKYRVYLETNDPTSTPTFSDITVNYSP